MDRNKIHTIILISGLVLGVAMASYSLIEESNISGYAYAAKIEDTSIPMDKYLQQLEGLAKDKRSPISQKDKEYVLERMIEEELLIKRAIDLGMLNSNPIARGTIVQQMIKTIISENDRYEITKTELEKFYNENKGFFAKSTRLRLQQIYFSDQEFGQFSLSQARKAYDLLEKGENLNEIFSLGSDSALRIPNTLMTLTKVREYIGPSLMNEAKKLDPGSYTEPLKVSGGYKIIVLLEKELAKETELEDIRDVVAAEYRKRMDDSSLRKYLENLKNWYDISRNLPE